MDTLQTLHWASTEVIYFGGYAVVIGVSLLTVLFARRAARIEDLERARAGMEPDRRLTVKKPSLFPCQPNVPAHANDGGNAKDTAA